MTITSRASDYSSFVGVHHRNSKIYTPYHILSGLPKYNELVVDMELGSGRRFGRFQVDVRTNGVGVVLIPVS
jgi:hypothetical protein